MTRQDGVNTSKVNFPPKKEKRKKKKEKEKLSIQS
jgi:hypothetical protein